MAPKRLTALKAQNRFFKFEETRETFRFGDGARVSASLLVIFEVIFLQFGNDFDVRGRPRLPPAVIAAGAHGSRAAD